MNYCICIGSVYDLNERSNVPAKKMSITKDQMDVLVLFAEKRIDKNCNPIYKIGACEFTIQPDIEAAIREAMNNK